MHITEKSYDWAFPLTERRKTELIILHHAAARKCTAEQIHSWHRTKGWAGIAYHYFVRKNGEVVRGRPEHTVGGHTYGKNSISLGICFEGDFQQETMPKAQMLSGAELVGELRQRYPQAKVTGHRDVGETSCPGKYFPFEEVANGMSYEQFEAFMERYLQALAAEEPADWSAEERAWAEENGILRGDGQDKKYKSFCTREEMVTFLKRLWDKTKEEN